MREVIFTVRPEEAGVRLDAYLQKKLRGPSRSRVQRIIREQLRPLGAGRLKPASVVKSGLRFAVAHESPLEDPLPEIPIVHEDEAILVLDKPANLAVHPAGRHHLHTLTAALAARTGNRAHPAHRLDRETSGLIACGIGPWSRDLKRAFALGEVQKEYLAISEGWPESETFAIDLPLELGTGHVRVRMAVGTGKPCRTEVRVVNRYRDQGGERFSLLRCAPRTGRQHQIRAHLGAAGFPVVGDKIYGPDESIFIRFTEGALTETDHRRLRLPRHALHAAGLTFRHPLRGSIVTFQSGLPADLSAFLQGLGAGLGVGGGPLT
jgi:23S rRNA pseudouridine1911/1915/1917 synthase